MHKFRAKPDEINRGDTSLLRVYNLNETAQSHNGGKKSCATFKSMDIGSISSGAFDILGGEGCEFRYRAMFSAGKIMPVRKFLCWWEFQEINKVDLIWQFGRRWCRKVVQGSMDKLI